MWMLFSNQISRSGKCKAHAGLLGVRDRAGGTALPRKAGPVSGGPAMQGRRYVCCSDNHKIS